MYTHVVVVLLDVSLVIDAVRIWAHFSLENDIKFLT